MAQITHHCGNPPISVKIRGKTTGRQHDLKGRMPEQSEWLLAEGAAKRNPRYRYALFDAKNANIGNLGDNIRVFQTLFFEDKHSGGYADAPPPAKSTRAIALGIQPFRLDTLAAYYRISITASPSW